MLFDSINAVKNIFHSILNVVVVVVVIISFPFVKAIFQPRTKNSGDFNRNEHLYRNRQQNNIIMYIWRSKGKKRTHK